MPLWAFAIMCKNTQCTKKYAYIICMIIHTKHLNACIHTTHGRIRRAPIQREGKRELRECEYHSCLYMYVYVCTYIHINICIHIYIKKVYIYIYMYINIHVYMWMRLSFVFTRGQHTQSQERLYISIHCKYISLRMYTCKYAYIYIYKDTHTHIYIHIYPCIYITSANERWGAGAETQKNVRGEIGGWGRVPFNETYAPSLSTIYDGA